MKRAILLAACVVALCVAAGEARAIQIAVPGLWVDVPIVIGGPGYPPPPLVQPAGWPYGPPPPPPPPPPAWGPYPGGGGSGGYGPPPGYYGPRHRHGGYYGPPPRWGRGYGCQPSRPYGRGW